MVSKKIDSWVGVCVPAPVNANDPGSLKSKENEGSIRYLNLFKKINRIQSQYDSL